MRWMIALLLLPVASAVVSDPSGDVYQAWSGQEAEVRPADGMDLTQLTVEETHTEFTFTLETAGVGAGAPNGWTTWVEFHHGQQGYRVIIQYVQPAGSTDAAALPWAYLMAQDGEQWATMRQVAASVTDNQVSWTLERSWLIDEKGTAPTKGASFTGFYARSYSNWVLLGPMALVGSTWHFDDRMPDEGTGSHAIQFGLEQRNARLASEEAFRVSNGEAGTFYFTAELSADEPGTFDLAVADVPNGWDIRLAAESVEVDDPVSIVVEATVPFSHSHGTQSAFRLLASNDDALAQIDMGIHYVATPQPSGHHQRVYIHAYSDAFDEGIPYTREAGARAYPFMNTLEEDPGNSGNPIESTRGGVLDFGSPGTTYTAIYDTVLSPRLRMGLNVTNEVTGFDLEFDVSHPMPDARVFGELKAWVKGESITIANLDSEPHQFDAGTNRITGSIAGIEQIIEYSKGNRLMVELTLEGTGIDVHESHIAAYLLPGGTLDLPLAEYSDSISDATGFVPAPPAQEIIDTFEEEAPQASKDSPGAPAILALLAALARRRFSAPSA